MGCNYYLEAFTLPCELPKKEMVELEAMISYKKFNEVIANMGENQGKKKEDLVPIPFWLFGQYFDLVVEDITYTPSEGKAKIKAEVV